MEATSFVGRRHETAEAKRILSVSRLLTLTGTAGVGKSRLAARVAEQIVRAFPDGVRLVPLAALQDGALVPHAVVGALGIRSDAGRAPLDTLIEHLGTRRLLLVLDNCEHLTDACATLVGAVLRETEGVRVLATSRHRLGLTEEHLLTVAPLRTPQGPVQGAVARFPALQLFADRASAVVPGFTITERNQEAVAALCRRLDGLPLAIELAAVRIRALSVEQLLQRIDDRFRLLSGGSPIAPPRHQTLRSAVEWSHGLCTPGEQAAWALLSVFTDSFDLSAAEAVCGADGTEPYAVLDAVSGLVDKSVLVSEGSDGAVRYRLLASLRHYGLEKLDGLGKTAAARRRHHEHFRQLAEMCEKQWFGPRQSEIIALLRAEQDNFRAALNFCLTSPGEADGGLHLVGTLWFYWSACGIWTEGRHWWQCLALREGANRPTGARARAHWVALLLTLVHSRSSALLLADHEPRAPLQPNEIPVIKPLADMVPVQQADRDKLISFLVLNRVELACTLAFQGRPDRAVPLCTEVLAVCETHGEQWARSYALRTLATAQWMLGEYGNAVENARECLRLEYVAGERQDVGTTLELLAAIAATAEDAEHAAVLQGAAGRIWYEAGHDPLGTQQEAGRVRVGERLARSALGDRGYERACRRGHELSASEALAYALGDRAGLPEPDAPAPGRPSAPRHSVVSGAAPGSALTPREYEVAGLIAQGLTNRQIADSLVISRRTAEGHVERILAKLGFATRSQVAAWFTAVGSDGRRAGALDSRAPGVSGTESGPGERR